MSKFKGMSVPVDKAERMTITHPISTEPLVDKSGKAAYLDLFSGDSERARSYNRRSTQKRLDMRGRAVVSAASIESDNYGLLAEITAGWYLVDLDGNPTDVITTGRHDPCVGLRATPIAEAMLALVLMDHYLRHRAQNGDVVSRTPVIPAQIDE